MLKFQYIVTPKISTAEDIERVQVSGTFPTHILADFVFVKWISQTQLIDLQFFLHPRQWCPKPLVRLLADADSARFQSHGDSRWERRNVLTRSWRYELRKESVQ